MKKSDEILDIDSYWNRVRNDERVFVLRAHDVAAPETIRFWAHHRVALGKNQPDDQQIVEAEACATLMEQERKPPRERREVRPEIDVPGGDGRYPAVVERDPTGSSGVTAKAPASLYDDEMVRGLVRAAQLLEERNGAVVDGKLWDDGARNALEYARKIGLAPGKAKP